MGRMLIVDDEQEIRNLMAQNFSMEGLEVDTASVAEEAILKAKSKQYDFMLVDLVLPGRLNGLDIIQRVRKVLPDIYIVAISGFCGNEISERVIHAGANNFVTKPFEHEELTRLIKKSKYLKYHKNES